MRRTFAAAAGAAIGVALWLWHRPRCLRCGRITWDPRVLYCERCGGRELMRRHLTMTGG